MGSGISTDGKNTHLVSNIEHTTKAYPENGVKQDEGKTRLDLLDPFVLIAYAEALSYGAVKYSDYNYKAGLTWSRCYAAAQRHLNAFWSGEDIDSESGLSHLAHAMCCIGFLLWFTKYRPEFDDRWTSSKEYYNYLKDKQECHTGSPEVYPFTLVSPGLCDAQAYIQKVVGGTFVSSKDTEI
jgi:hypothetical protein